MTYRFTLRMGAALALALAASAPFGAAALAQTVTGTAVAPSTVENSATRPISFAASAPASGVLVVLMADTTLPTLSGFTLDDASRSAITAAIAAGKYKGKEGERLSLRGIGPYARILLVGIGTATDSDARTSAMRNAGGRAAQDLADEAQPVQIALPTGVSAEHGAQIALGYALGQYRFDRYKTVGKTMPSTEPVTIVGGDSAAMSSLFTGRYEVLARSVAFARDLAAEPANVLYPEVFVERTRTAFAGVPNVTIEVLDEVAMRKLNMGSLLGVGQGSRRPSRLMVVRYQGKAGSTAPLALVGKGITFDSGGISLKPGAGMWEMKSDMAGAANVMAAVHSLARSGAPVDVLGVAALAENMPGSNAQRPGDVVRTMSGKTIEVLNTDAEGRLVLADATEYVVSKYKPSGVVTMATLTGAIIAALDDEYAGLFARDESLNGAVQTAGTSVGEATWRMPLHKNYGDDMKSSIADIKNVVEGGRPGAGLGAHFVGYFVDEKTPWAHLDIAGVNWDSNGDAITPKGASGWGVRLLDALARNWPPVK
jgi:leucyl aminopeptidase